MLKTIHTIAASVGLISLISIPPASAEVGLASWYGGKFHGRRTASGKVYNQWGHTCAHKTHAFGTRLRVARLDNGRSIECLVTDRGPFIRGRIVDLSKAGASALGFSGLVRVRVSPIPR